MEQHFIRIQHIKKLMQIKINMMMYSKSSKERRKWLEEEINEERRKNGYKAFEYKDEVEEKEIKISTTDKESGYYHRDNKEKGFMYLDHRTVDDKCNIIVDCTYNKRKCT